MRITEETEDRLVIDVADAVFSRALLVLFIVFAGATAAMYLYDPRASDTEKFWGALMAAVLFLVAFLAVYERASFVFDRADRQLVWQRRRAFSNQSGKIRFDEIRDVVMQTTGSRVNPRKRVTLFLAADGELPLSIAYAPDPSGSFARSRESIQQFVR